MVLDIIAVIVIIIFMYFGFKQGFFQSLLGIISWLIAFAMSFVWFEPFKNLVREKTDIYENILQIVKERLSTEDYIANLDVLPTKLYQSIEALSLDFVNNTSTSLADTFFSILCFVVLFIGIKIILWAIIKLLTLQSQHGVLRVTDGLLGMILGFIKGLVGVLIIFALLVPMISLSDESVREFINNDIERSKVAKEIYKNNIIVNFSNSIKLPEN